MSTSATAVKSAFKRLVIEGSYARAKLEQTEPECRAFLEHYLAFHWPLEEGYGVSGEQRANATPRQRRLLGRQYFKVDVAVESSKSANRKIELTTQLIVEAKPDKLSNKQKERVLAYVALIAEAFREKEELSFLYVGVHFGTEIMFFICPEGEEPQAISDWLESKAHEPRIVQIFSAMKKKPTQRLRSAQQNTEEVVPYPRLTRIPRGDRVPEGIMVEMRGRRVVVPTRYWQQEIIGNEDAMKCERYNIYFVV